MLKESELMEMRSQSLLQNPDAQLKPPPKSQIGSQQTEVEVEMKQLVRLLADTFADYLVSHHAAGVRPPATNREATSEGEIRGEAEEEEEGGKRGRTADSPARKEGATGLRKPPESRREGD